MTVLIVGHGPSLRNAARGSEIDTHTVVRLKQFTRFHDIKDYGTKTDYLCASTEAALGMLKTTATPKEYWLYPKRGEYNKSIHDSFKGKPHVVPLDETEIWNGKFKKETGYKKEDGARGRNISTGLAAIVIAASRLKPEKIVLAGFDTLLDPAIKYESVYNPGTQHDQMHFWAIENNLLKEISTHYKVEFIPL